MVERAVAPLREALTHGIEMADAQQPDAMDRDQYYWSHTARFHARKKLMSADRDGWGIAKRVANSGIHLHFEAVHTARVLRTLNGTTPHAGHNVTRQQAWSFSPYLPVGKSVPEPFTLIFDWCRDDSGLLLHVGLPRRGGSYPNGAELHWRVPVTGDAQDDLAGLAWDGSDPEGSASVIKVDPSENYRGEMQW